MKSLGSSALADYTAGIAWNASKAVAVACMGLAARASGLRLAPGGTPASQVAVTADRVTVRNAGGTLFGVIEALSATADLTTSGAGGLDTGSEASSTWYYLFAISDTSGTNPDAVLLSTSATSPTLPAGYDVFARLGAAYNDGGSDLVPFTQDGPVALYDARQALLSTSSDSGGFVDVDASALAPAGCRSILVHAEAEGDGSSAAVVTTALRRNGASGAGAVIAATLGGADELASAGGWLAVDGSRLLEADSDFPAGASGTSRAFVLGYREPWG